MSNDISDKDKTDWNHFINNKEKLPNKDLAIIKKKSYKIRSLDLHGLTLEEANKAIEDFQLCLEINPNCYEALWNKSLTHLMIGEYEIGWKLYEYRWNTKNFTSKKPNYQKPLWTGYESLIGKTILLHSEQGLGDSIQFCRYIKFLKMWDLEKLLI